MKRYKYSTKHTHICWEEEWGSDNRYTICKLCGKQRYYPQGYDGVHKENTGKVVINGAT